jgi:hypothetical protein
MRGFGGILAASVLSAVVGCHKAPVGNAGAGKPVDAVSAPGEAFPERAPFVGTGERMQYRLGMHGMDVASYTVVVGDITQMSGRDVVVIQAGVESSPLVSLVHKVSDNFTSWVDVKTSRPVLFRAAELRTPDSGDVETTDAEMGTVVDGSFAVKVSEADGDPKEERQSVAELPLFDFNGFLMVLRSWEPPKGTSASADVMRSSYIWRTTVTLAGYEDVVTDLGTLPAVRIDGVSHRLLRDGTDDPKSDERRYSIWISDDADRVPLQLVARTDYGDLRMDIVDYQSGGVRLGE